MAQSPVIILPGLQQQPRAGPVYPVPSSFSSSGVCITPGRKAGITRQPSLEDACLPNPPLHQGSSSSTSVSSSIQQQPAPTPRGSSSSGGGNPSVTIPATRDHGLAFKQASSAIDQSHRLFPRNPCMLHLSAPSLLRSVASTQVSRCSLQSQCGARGIVHGPQRNAASEWLRLCPPVIQSITARGQPLKLFPW